MTIKLDDCGVVPLIVIEAGDRAHAGGLVVDGVTEQVRFTVPVKPFDGEMVRETVLPVVAPRVMVSDELPPLMVNVGAGLMVTEPLM